MEFNATFLISALSFIVFVFIMNTILYKPILKIISQRNALLKSNEEAATDAEIKSSQLAEMKAKELSEAKKKAQETVAEGTEKFKQKTKEITDEYIREQREKAESEKLRLHGEANEVKAELSKTGEGLAEIIADKVLEVPNA